MQGCVQAKLKIQITTAFCIQSVSKYLQSCEILKNLEVFSGQNFYDEQRGLIRIFE